MEIRIPKLTGYQEDVWNWLGDPYKAGKIAVIKSVRQSGKSFFCLMKIIEMAFTHSGTISVIYEPSLLQGRVMYNLMEKYFSGSNLIKSANASLLTIDFINGSKVLFKSVDQDSRGFTISGLLVLDECAYLDDDSIYSILPLVNANNASIIIASTPFTMEGYYFEMFMIGKEESTDTLKAFDWSKEKEVERFLTPERKKFYKQTMSRQKYTTEVLGDFLTDDGLLFQNLNACINDTPSKPMFLYIGIDFGTGSDGDYTVLSAVNEKGEQYKLYRTNNLSPMQQVDWLAGLINELEKECEIAKVFAEQNSIGKVYIDALNLKIKTKLTNWTTSNDSKQQLVTTFQIALENENVSILNNDVLLNELRRYTAEINQRTKKITYNGKNAHDDTVIATMLSYYALKSSLGVYNISYYKPVRKKKSLKEKYG